MAWYDVNKTLSYNRLFNFVVGARSIGKTYALKKRAIKNFLDKGHHFVYLRRYDVETEETAEPLFNDIIANNEFPDHRIEFKAGCYYLDDRLFGYAMSLTQARNYKSISYPLVWLIIFDEFQPEEKRSGYLQNEPHKFLNFYMSIDRYRGCIVVFLSNAVSSVNPYFSFFGLELPYNSTICAKKRVLLEVLDDQEFIKERENTPFGELVEGTTFADYAIRNKFKNDNKAFIEKKTAKSSYYFTLKYEGDLYGVWVDLSINKMFVSNDVLKSCVLVYAIVLEDHEPNTMLIKRAKKSAHFKNFIEAYKDGCVRFENQKIKTIIYDVIKKCIT